MPFSLFRRAFTKPHIFISYSHQDAVWVRGLVKALVRRRFRVWFDEYSLDIPTDLFVHPTELAGTLQQAVESTEIYLIIMTEKSLTSGWVLRELEYAQHAGRRVYPVRQGHVWPHDLPDPLAQIQWLDATDGDVNTVVKDIARYARMAP